MAEVTVVRTVSQDTIDASLSTVSQQLDLKAPLNLSISQKTGNYTIQSSDNGKMIEMGGLTTNVLTVPPDSTSFVFPVGGQVTIVQSDVSTANISAGAGVTIVATPGLNLRTRWSSATLIKRSANSWIAIGDLVA